MGRERRERARRAGERCRDVMVSGENYVRLVLDGDM